MEKCARGPPNRPEPKGHRMAEDQDKGYRLLFSFPRMVEDLIRLFVGGKWVKRLDFSTLQKVSERDVSAELVRREKDLLTSWRCAWPPTAACCGRTCFVRRL